MDSQTQLSSALQQWDGEIGESDFNPVPLLTSIVEIIERETENYLKLPIDPFDERHPYKASPECTLGVLLKDLYKNESLMSLLTNEYIESRSLDLHIICSRLLLDILPGLDHRKTFKDAQDLVEKLVSWAADAQFPLNYYATGLLGAAMEVNEISSLYREKQQHLVPIMFTRLKQLTFNRTGVKRKYPDNEGDDQMINECSSSSWAEVHMSGSYQMDPLNIVMQQRFILKYLSALSCYQELLVHMFEHKAISYILHFIDWQRNQDIRLAFDALKFLASFLNYKKFALEFLDHDGLNQLLKVSKHGMASSGICLCLYHLARNEDVLEKICWMERETVERMVSYGLWTLECAHDLSRAYAAMFFSLCFQFPLLLRLFDRDNGLRKLLNFLSMRGLLSDSSNERNELSDDDLRRVQNAKQVCMALKKYARAHLLLTPKDKECRPIILSDEKVLEAVEQHKNQSVPRTSWRAIDKLVHEEGISYLLKVITQICYNFVPTGKNEAVRSALEVLVVASLSPRVQKLLVKETNCTADPLDRERPALSIIIMCADPEIKDPECIKSALNVLINLVSSNYQHRIAVPDLCRSTPGSGRKKGPPRNLSEQLREAVWANNGTLILPKLLTIVSPLTEADIIRSLACRVLCGLAKEENIRREMSKLPLFTDGQLQSLMKPILPEKTEDYETFRQYCKELIQLVTGTSVTLCYGIDPSEMKRRKVVEKTKIVYEEASAQHLIHNYLNSKGFPEAAAVFYKEANLSSKPIKTPVSSAPNTLDSIFTKYLRYEHCLCENPVATCPPFDLLAPHRCPKSKNRHLPPQNVASRIIKRKNYPARVPSYGAKFDRQYVYSKFRPFKLVRDIAERASSTCCAFTSDGQYLLVGTDCGVVKAFDINTGSVGGSYECHNHAVGYVESSRDDSLIITTCPDAPHNPQCALWNFSGVFERRHRFDNDTYAEFGKTCPDRIITTQASYARLWDTTTGALINKYDSHSQDSSNRATLNYTDTLVLYDGRLWDVRLPTPIHTFRKFNEHINGIFHPNGNEIIYGSQVQDIRNFRLLRTVKEFDMCQLKFNSMGDVIYSTILDDDQSEDLSKTKSEFRTSFRTFDSTDYSTISTIDLKRTISDLAVCKGDQYIGLVESSSNRLGFQEDYIMESVCRIYEVGRARHANVDTADDDEDDDAEDEENDDEDDDDEDDDDDEIGSLGYDGEDYEEYSTDENADDEDVEDDTSDSHLSSSAASQDELVPRYYL